MEVWSPLSYGDSRVSFGILVQSDRGTPKSTQYPDRNLTSDSTIFETHDTNNRMFSRKFV